MLASYFCERYARRACALRRCGRVRCPSVSWRVKQAEPVFSLPVRAPPEETHNNLVCAFVHVDVRSWACTVLRSECAERGHRARAR